MLIGLQGVYFVIFIICCITNPDRWELEYISFHAILMKKVLGMRRFFFFFFFTLWKTLNERQCISMLVIYHTGQCIWKCQYFIFYLFLITFDMFSWEKLLTDTLIGMMKCHILFDGNKSDFLLLRFLYQITGLYDC